MYSSGREMKGSRHGSSRFGTSGLNGGGAAANAGSSNRPYAMRGGAGLRVDPLGNVHYDGNSDNSDDDDVLSSGHASYHPGLGSGRRVRSPSIDGLMGMGFVGSQQLQQQNVNIKPEFAIDFTPAAYLRPKVIPPSSRARFAPPAVSNATLTGFHEEDLIILFGGAEDVKPTNETWLYYVQGKVWQLYDPLDPVDDEARALREARGLAAEVLPPPRSGHCAAGMGDIPESAPLRASDISGIGGGSSSDQSGHHHHHHHGNQRDSMLRRGGAQRTNVSKLDDAEIVRALVNDPSAPKSLADRELSAEGAAAAAAHAARQLEYNPSLLVFGGADLSRGKYFNDLWRFDVQCRCWEELKPLGTPPSPRWQCTAAVLEERLFVFGGESATFQLLNDLHLYDHAAHAWRSLRVVAPVPPPRMHHSAVTIGDKMVICGGIGVQGKTDIGGGGSDIANFAATPGGAGALAGTSRDTTDVWILEMRTLLWRQVGVLDKHNSPFVVHATVPPPATTPSTSGGAAAAGNTTPALGSSSLLNDSMAGLSGGMPLSNASVILPAAFGGGGGGRSTRSPTTVALLPPGARLSPLEGHVAMAFDNFMVIHGGRHAGSKFNKNIYAFDVVAERWHLLGEAPSHGNTVSPQVRSMHCACTFVEKSLTSTLDLASTLDDIENARLHISDEAEMRPVFNAMITRLAAQLSFTGIMGFAGTKPMLTRTVCGFVYGGSGYPRHFADLWKVDFSDSAHTSDEYDTITAAEANKRRERMRIEGQMRVLGQLIDLGSGGSAGTPPPQQQSPERGRSRGGRSPVRELTLDAAEDVTVDMAEEFVFHRHVAAPGSVAAATKQSGANGAASLAVRSPSLPSLGAGGKAPAAASTLKASKSSNAPQQLGPDALNATTPQPALLSTTALTSPAAVAPTPAKSAGSGGTAGKKTSSSSSLPSVASKSATRKK